MANGDTKTNQYLDIAANGTRADLPSDTCCETRTQSLIRGVAERVMDVEDEVERLENNPDVVDIVATYADLQAYDTSTLTDKDVIRVLTDSTHNNNSTFYRWNAATSQFDYIGEVTSGPTVVQTIGTSTTDVMSQKAVTDELYNNANSLRVQIGNNAVSTGESYFSTIAVGTSSEATKSGAVAVGQSAKVSGRNSISIGSNSECTQTDCIAIGHSAKVATTTAVSGIAIGFGAYSSGVNNISLGNATSTGGTSSGLASYSVALGAYSKPTLKGQVDISTLGSTNTYGYNNSQYRLLSGLYDGQSAHDAATYGQVISYSAINGAGAPTTTTEGKYVGQLYYDTTNEAMYFLKSIDTTVTPTTYTWESLGGSSVNVVQSTGQSTTDVMSQKAVTDELFHNGNKAMVQIGFQASSTGGTYYQSVAIGRSSSAGKNGVAIGAINATATTEGSIAIGTGATCATTNGSAAIAIGDSANSGSLYGISIGASARTGSSASGAIAIGAGSQALSAGEFNIGSSNTSYGYNSSNYRLLTGLYDPQNAHDAATKGYVDGLVGNIESALNTINNGTGE